MQRILRLSQFATALVLLALISVAAHARFLRPDLERVPVERLAKNIEEAAKKNEKQSKQLQYNLARLHAMAYALKTDTVETSKRDKQPKPWFGYTPKHVPFQAKPTDDKDKLKAAKEHLDKAIEIYEQVIKQDPKFLPAKIGHAWSVEQAGKKEQAIKEYREILDEAWKTEKDQRFLPLGGNTITAEAGGYLVALLDKETNKDEIATIQERIAKLKKLPRPVTPIVVPLQPDTGVEALEAPSAEVMFDADGSGLQRRWSWITQKGAWLVHDPMHTGRVTSAIHMFGNVSFWLFWDTGYDALAALDDNTDGELTGHELQGLALWHDRNSNGISEPGEVKPVADYDIVGLSCRHSRLASHRDNIPHSPTGVRYRDGSTRTTFDLLLQPND